MLDLPKLPKSIEQQLLDEHRESNRLMRLLIEAVTALTGGLLQLNAKQERDKLNNAAQVARAGPAKGKR